MRSFLKIGFTAAALVFAILKITERNNDTNTVLLSGLKKNVRVKKAEFKVNLPKGTKIIKN